MTLLERMRARLAELADQRAERQAALDAINDAVEARGDDSLTEEESQQLSSILEELRGLDAERQEAEERIAQLEENERQRQAADEARGRFERNPEERTPIVRVNEELTYRREGHHGFFSDVYRAMHGLDFDAQERLRRHAREMRSLGQRPAVMEGEYRAVDTGDGGGLVVPIYLVEEFANVLRNGRAFANAVRRLPLAETGMANIIPRAVSGSSTDSQTPQNTEVSETDVDFNNDLTVPVRTIAGKQEVSRQWIERGTAQADQLIYEDLVADYAQELDRQCIAGDGNGTATAGGEHKGVLTAIGTIPVTYTDDTPTVPELWPVIAEATGKVANQNKRGANLLVMTSLRWAWIKAARDEDGRPLVNTDPSEAVNAMGQAASEFGEGQLAGVFQGLPVLLDDNIPTNLGTGQNEDRILVVRRQEPILWETGDGMPRQLTFEQTKGDALTTTLVVYGYSAFTAERRPKGVALVGGTGLVDPFPAASS